MGGKYEVVVAGGGPGGVCAALAAARNGARTALVERYGFLGGMATAGLVNPFMTYKNGIEQIIRGIFGELLEELRRRGALHENGASFDEETLKAMLDEKMAEAGVEVWFHSLLTGVKKSGKKVTKAVLATRGGEVELAGKMFVDSTGDGDLAALAGAKVEQGREGDGAVQPMTLCFRMGGVRTEELKGWPWMNEYYREAKKAGELTNPRNDAMYFWTVHPGVVHFNTTRIAGNPLDARDMSAAEVEGRRQTQEFVTFLKKRVPGFEKAFLIFSATQIGVRESRRIMGSYVLTEEDVLAARKFDDGIGRSSYDIDIHDPRGGGTVIKRLKTGTSYEVPYRCLVPGGLDNVLVGSRCISATHSAHSSLRTMPLVMAIGEAAGTAAAMCAKGKVKPAKLDAGKLREQLTKQGADLRRE